MKKHLIFCLAGAMLALVGCKTKVYAPVTYSEIFGEPQTKIGALVVEVPACKDRSDKFDSNSLIEAKQKVPYVFPKAEYIKCERERFESFAFFKVPFQVGGTADNCGKDKVCIYHSRNNKYANALIGEDILNKAKELGNIKGDDLKFNLLFDNDSGREINMLIVASYIEDNPLSNDRIILNKDAKDLPICLDNVGASKLLKGKYVNIFSDLDRKEEQVK